MLLEILSCLQENRTLSFFWCFQFFCDGPAVGRANGCISLNLSAPSLFPLLWGLAAALCNRPRSGWFHAKIMNKYNQLYHTYHEKKDVYIRFKIKFSVFCTKVHLTDVCETRLRKRCFTVLALDCSKTINIWKIINCCRI